jgi:predicted acetyltransferase
MNQDLDIANIPSDRVPAYTYFYVREEDYAIVGMINIRLALNEFLRREGGHIGYSIRPTERRKGYATAMLRETLVFCGNIGLRNIIIACDKENPASAGVIKNCGGVLDAEFYSDTFKTVVQRYHIGEFEN